MSIKQNGGVFGRNPTFNDVTIEGQLTFDGDIDINSDLKVDGNLEVDGAATIDQDAVALAFKVTGGNGGVNVAEFSRDIGVDATVGINGNSGDPQIYFESPSNTFAIGTNSTVFEIADNNVIGTNTRFAISSVGDVSISTGNLVIGTSGKGIDFSATSGTGTSELLDDYEEGTWTPTLGGDTTYTAQSGTYTKVGNKVTVVGKITVNTLGTGSTTVVSGLPFTSANTTEAGGLMSYFTGIASAKSCVNASVDKNNTTITFVSVAAAGGTSTDIVAVFANSTDCRFTVTYLV